MIHKFILSLNVMILLSIIKRIVSNVKITSPSELVNQFDSDIIPHQYGKFGKIPYATTLSGRVFYKYNKDQDLGCDISKMTPFSYDPENINIPMILLDDGDCRYTKKALNTEMIGGGVAVIISDKNELKEDDTNNFDDGLGDKIKIPTVIIPKKHGEKIKDYMQKNPHLASYVRLSINFKMQKSNKVDVKLFLNSADPRSIHFFVEFESFFKRLGDKVNIEPIYKYYNCSWCDYSKNIINPNCIDDGAYCGVTSQAFKIKNGTIMLEENMRQKCIYLISDNKETYWQYMIKFSKTCADFMEPKFDSQCANEIVSALKLDTSKLNACMDNVFKSKNFTLLRNDKDSYNKNKVFQLPQMRINNQKFRGGWYSRNFLEAICTAMIEPAEICLNTVPEAGMGWGTIFFIIFLIIIVNIVFIYCYKRIVNRSLESSIEDKIQTQTIFSLGQYKVFQDAEPQKKVLVKNEDY